MVWSRRQAGEPGPHIHGAGQVDRGPKSLAHTRGGLARLAEPLQTRAHGAQPMTASSSQQTHQLGTAGLPVEAVDHSQQGFPPSGRAGTCGVRASSPPPGRTWGATRPRPRCSRHPRPARSQPPTPPRLQQARWVSLGEQTGVLGMGPGDVGENSANRLRSLPGHAPARLGVARGARRAGKAPCTTSSAWGGEACTAAWKPSPPRVPACAPRPSVLIPVLPTTNLPTTPVCIPARSTPWWLATPLPH